MSRSLNGTTSSITGTITALSDADYSYGAWILPTTAGEGNNGIILEAEISATPRQILEINSASYDVSAYQDYSGTDARSTSSTVVTGAGVWTLVVATHRASDNKLRIYYGNLATAAAEVSYSTQTAGTTTFQTGATAAYVGSRSNGGQTFSGSIAHAFMIAREISLAEVEQYRQGDYGALYNTTVVPNYLLPMDSSGNTIDIARRITFTPTTTTFTTDPPIAAGFNAQAVVVNKHAATPVSLALSPATVTVTGQAHGLTAGAATAALAPATITVTAQAQGVTPGAVTPALSPATITVTAETQDIFAEGGDVSLALSPATVTVTAQALTPTGTLSLDLAPATITVTPQAFGTTPGATTAALSPATITVTPAIIDFSVPVTPEAETEIQQVGSLGRRGPYESLETIAARRELERDDEEILCLV